jgi:hypothetical protein
MYGQRNYLYLNAASTADAYGEYTVLDYSSGSRYGEYKELNSNSTYDGDVYGDYNRLYGSGDGTNYGVFNAIDATGTGTWYGMYNDIIGTGTGTKYGVRNEFADVAGNKYGVYNYVPPGTSAGIIYGVMNDIQSDAISTKYGTYNYVSGGDGALRGSYNSVHPATTNSSTIYGVYGYVGANGTGTHYGGYFYAYGDGNIGVYGANAHNTGYAGYFVGNGYWDGDMIFNESGLASHNFRIETDARTHAFYADATNDVIRIGVSNGPLTGDGGSYGGTTADYVIDMDNGVNQGTTIGIGSIEFMLDGVARTLINNEFDPAANIIYDLGNSSTSEAWDDVYADDYWNVSDIRTKSDVADMAYGLDEIMQMRTIAYTLTDDPFQDRKIGVVAQEVSTLVPEAVKTHDDKILDESSGAFEEVELDRMAVSYTRLVPVLIKAVQEQQALIQSLQQRIEELEQQ